MKSVPIKELISNTSDKSKLSLVANIIKKENRTLIISLNGDSVIVDNGLGTKRKLSIASVILNPNKTEKYINRHFNKGAKK